MKFWLLGIWFNFFSFSALAQQDSTKTWQIRWGLAGLLDPRTPCFQVGLQKHITPQWIVSAEYGVSVYGFLGSKWYNDSTRGNFRYQKIRAEIKYARPPQSTAINPDLRYQLYLGLEGLYIPERYNKQMDYFYQKNNRYDFAFSQVKNSIYVTCLKGGMEWEYNKKWIVDTYAGLGPRFIYIQHYNSIPGSSIYSQGGWQSWLSPAPRDQTAGWHKTLHVALGLKLGYYIW